MVQSWMVWKMSKKPNETARSRPFLCIGSTRYRGGSIGQGPLGGLCCRALSSSALHWGMNANQSARDQTSHQPSNQ